MLLAPRPFRLPGLRMALVLSVGMSLAALPTAHARPKSAKAGTARANKPPRAPKVTPNQEGKIVVFPIKDDDDRSITSQVERLFRSHGLEVVPNVRGVDNAEQFRELAGTLGLVAFVDGSLKEGETNAKVTLQLRSGYTGKRAALTTFKETKLHIRSEIEDKLWSKFGPAMARACVDAAKPRKRGRGPLMIEAGTPLAASDSQPN